MKSSCKFCAFNALAINNLTEESFDQLNANHAVVEFKKGDSIIRQGTFSTNVAFLRAGLVKLHMAGPHYEQIVRLVKAPSYLGLPTTFGDKINQYSVTAVANSEVCFIDIEVFKNLFKKNGDFSYEIFLELCRNELVSYRRCANRTQRQARGNVAAFLLELSNDIFEADKFILPLSQLEIGNLVDTTRESISRVLSEFNSDGVISMKGKVVQLLNKPLLELISKNG